VKANAKFHNFFLTRNLLGYKNKMRKTLKIKRYWGIKEKKFFQSDRIGGFMALEWAWPKVVCQTDRNLQV